MIHVSGLETCWVSSLLFPFFKYCHHLSSPSSPPIALCRQVDCVSDLLKSLKALMVRCCVWDKVTSIDQLRLDTTHRMLNIPHFNAKMNALKEVWPHKVSYNT